MLKEVDSGYCHVLHHSKNVPVFQAWRICLQMKFDGRCTRLKKVAWLSKQLVKLTYI